jgi:hypothetical protein
LSFIQIWNNKNFDTLLHLVGIYFMNCRCPLGRRRSALDCSAIEEEVEEEGVGEGGEEEEDTQHY